jgi:two-component system, chemotaxis family, sensor kinase CheA
MTGRARWHQGCVEADEAMTNLRVATKVAIFGQVEIESTPGQGTVFKLQLPLTLAISDGMVARVGELRYVFPTGAVAMTMRADQLYSIADDGRLVAFRGRTIPVYRLSDLSSRLSGQPPSSVVVVLNDGEGHAAVLVDEILGKQQVVTQSLGEAIPAIGWIAGSAELGDGHIGLIVEPTNLIARFRATAPRDVPGQA